MFKGGKVKMIKSATSPVRQKAYGDKAFKRFYNKCYKQTNKQTLTNPQSIHAFIILTPL